MEPNSKGFTLVEVLVVMVVFIVVIAISGDAFNTILTHASKMFRSEESNIEGIVGLEMLRHDIQQAGFGLISESSPVAYAVEAVVAPASNYNDGVNGPPRPLVADTISAIADIPAESDYLVIKATNLGRNGASQKWSYLTYSSGYVSPHIWTSNSENFIDNDRVVLVQRRIGATSQTASLVPAVGSFRYLYSNTAFSHLSSTSSSIINVYGVSGAASSDLRMPFNRTDYFVSTSSTKPAVCSKDPNVGVLRKTSVNHADGQLEYIPILDCVADMQVVLGWDLRDGGGAAGNDGSIDTWSDARGAATAAAGGGAFAAAIDVQAAMASAAAIQSSLKVVKVYVLAQQGRKDPQYTSPNPIIVGDPNEVSLTRAYTLSSEMVNYRWKLHRMVVRPKNLTANK